MSAIFQRPLCDMGRAYDFAFRPRLGDPDPTSGGPCDDRPRRVELCAASAHPTHVDVVWQGFELCPEHEHQLRAFDARQIAEGALSRFREVPEAPAARRR